MSIELIIFWAIFFFILGFTTAYIIFRLREERSAAIKAKSEPPDPQAGGPEVRLPVSRNIRVWVEVDGQQVEAEVKQAGKPISSTAERPPIQLPASLTTESPLAASAPPSPVLPTENVPPFAPPPQTLKPAGSTQVSPISPVRDPINTLLRAVQSRAPKPDSQPTSIISQIDEVLQEQLTALHLLERKIHLVEKTDHSMAVQVGLEHYESIEAVPDEETRSMLRSAIQEWEYRNMGGKT